MEDSRDLIRHIQRIELKTHALVRGIQSGNHRSIFKGQGIEFSEIREYVPGDDIRAIDWKVTARLDAPYVREFTEERDQAFYFLLDLSASGSFGSEVSRRHKMLEVTASLMFAALRNNDSIGLCIFTDRIEKFIPARKGRKHLIAVLNTLVRFRPASKGTDLNQAIRYLSSVIRRQSSVIIISDFLCDPFFRSLRILSGRHEVTAIRITDPREGEMPDVGLIELEDPETGTQILVDTSDEAFRRRYADIVAESDEDLKTGIRRCRSGLITLSSDQPYEIPLQRFLSERRPGVI